MISVIPNPNYVGSPTGRSAIGANDRPGAVPPVPGEGEGDGGATASAIFAYQGKELHGATMHFPPQQYPICSLDCVFVLCETFVASPVLLVTEIRLVYAHVAGR